MNEMSMATSYSPPVLKTVKHDNLKLCCYLIHAESDCILSLA